MLKIMLAHCINAYRPVDLYIYIYIYIYIIYIYIYYIYIYIVTESQVNTYLWGSLEARPNKSYFSTSFGLPCCHRVENLTRDDPDKSEFTIEWI